MSKLKGTEGIKRQAQELIDQAYERGFKAGKEAFIKAEAKVANGAYQQGLDDAWEAAKKLYQFNPHNNKQVCEELFENYFNETICSVSASEAIAKIKAFEEQKKAEEAELKVGDEVYDKTFGNAVVIEISLLMSKVSLISDDGSVFTSIDAIGLQKTGRTFPQIAEVLKQLQEGKK